MTATEIAPNSARVELVGLATSGIEFNPVDLSAGADRLLPRSKRQQRRPAMPWRLRPAQPILLRIGFNLRTGQSALDYQPRHYKGAPLTLPWTSSVSSVVSLPLIVDMVCVRAATPRLTMYQVVVVVVDGMPSLDV